MIKKQLLSIALIFTLMTPLIGQNVVREMDNPQTSMVGARLLSLGGTNPTIAEDINGLFINPATMGYLDPMPFSITSRTIVGEIEVLSLHMTYPMEVPIPLDNGTHYQQVGFALSYGSNQLTNIPLTLFEDSTIRQTDQFNSGFEVLQLSGSTRFLDIYGFNTLSAGLAFKTLQQKINSSSRTGYGVDIGAIGTYHLQDHYVEKVHIGVSIQNFLSTSLVWPDLNQEATLPVEVYLGLRADMMDEKLSLYVNNSKENAFVGAEYYIQKDLQLRGSTDLSDINLGLGVNVENVAGFNGTPYSMRVDFNYTQKAPPLDSDPNYALSLTVLGKSKPKTPQILSPKDNFTTQSKTAKIRGVGPKETTIQIFNNQTLTRTTTSDKYGNWEFKEFPLKEGENEINIQAFSLDKDISESSKKVMIKSDTQAPKIATKIYPEQALNSLEIDVEANEPVDDIIGFFKGNEVQFFKESPTSWTTSIELPEELKQNSPAPDSLFEFSLVAIDSAGNQTKEIKEPFYMTLEYPTDKTVHYAKEIRYLGTKTPMAKQITINGSPVIVDTENNFSLTSFLDIGKNKINVNVETPNGKSIQHSLRVLYLKSFPDISNPNNPIKERREIEFLATIGLLDGDLDGNFYPDKQVTRRYISRIMTKAAEYQLDQVKTNLFKDVPAKDPDAPYIKAAIDNGLIFAFPDGSFKPDLPLTYSEVIFLLSNAGIIDEDSTSFTNTPITRRALAQHLAYTPQYEILIERLIDWETGY